MIRAATPADADAIAGVQVRAWKRAYADFLPEAMMPEAVAARARWQTNLEEGAAARRTTLVYELGGRISGYASVGPARGDDAEPGVGELMAVYVDPVAQGAGVGRALMDAAEARLRGNGYAEAVLWVFAANAMAREFYARRGWVLEPEAVNVRLNRWAPGVRYRLAL